MSGNYNRKDHLYQKAKQEGYRSRAAYKLLELDQRFRLIAPNSKILDLGCAPGSWLQVVEEKLSPQGIAIGIDLEKTDPFKSPQIHLIQGDVSSEEVLAQAQALVSGPFDIVLSDMAHKLTGITDVDRAGVKRTCELAFGACKVCLRDGGNFVLKVFKNQESDKFFKGIRTLFKKLERVELDATRSSSNEYYIVGLGYKK